MKLLNNFLLVAVMALVLRYADGQATSTSAYPGLDLGTGSPQTNAGIQVNGSTLGAFPSGTSQQTSQQSLQPIQPVYPTYPEIPSGVSQTQAAQPVNQTSIPVTITSTSTAALANTSSTANATDTASSNAATSASTPTTTAPTKIGIDQKDGRAESLVDYALGLAGYNDQAGQATKPVTGAGEASKYNTTAKATPVGEITGTPSLPIATDTTQVPASTTTITDIRDCTVPPTLEGCGMPKDIQAYFHDNITVSGIMASIFDPELVQVLAENCAPGEWCLPYQDQLNIMDNMEKFYLSGPLCLEDMWMCLQSVKGQRLTCEDKELDFLMNITSTLCELSEYAISDKTCYARTTEALYATYANMFPVPTKKPAETNVKFCDSYTAKMTKTYLCADDACSYDEIRILERFQPWVQLASNATYMSTYCNMSSVCQYETEETIEEELEEALENAGDYLGDDYYGDGDEKKKKKEGNEEGEEEEEDEETSETVTINDMPVGGAAGSVPVEDTTASVFTGETAGDSPAGVAGDNISVGAGASDELENLNEAPATDENVLLGLIVMTTLVAIVVLTLSVVVYRRFRASRGANYWRGYSQLSEEEKMLKNEYS